MLVLSRRVGERVVIGDGITVTVTRVAGQRVMLGIEAPAGVRILRGELGRRGESASEDIDGARVVGGAPVQVGSGSSPLALALTP